MLEKWLETLEKEKQGAIDKVKSIPTDPKTAEVAIKEIEVNYSTIKNYLGIMDNEGFRLNDDLSCINEDYYGENLGKRRDSYMHFANHISNHLWKIRHMPIQVEDGTFKPEFSPYY